MEISELYQVFCTEVLAHSDEVDSDNTRDWYALSLGWAIGKGQTISRAYEFASHVIWYA